MSKRAGTVVTLDDLVEMVGVDAARYSLIRSSVDVNIDIDLDPAPQAVQREPGVLRAVRPRGRLAALARNAADLGLEADLSVIALLTEPTEGDLIRPRRFPGRRRDGRRPARTAPDLPVPGDAGRCVPPLLHAVPRASHRGRRGHGCEPRPAGTGARRPAKCWPTVWRWSACRRRSGCDDDRHNRKG